jgi:hypothetical protein
LRTKGWFVLRMAWCFGEPAHRQVEGGAPEIADGTRRNTGWLHQPTI